MNENPEMTGQMTFQNHTTYMRAPSLVIRYTQYGAGEIRLQIFDNLRTIIFPVGEIYKLKYECHMAPGKF